MVLCTVLYMRTIWLCLVLGTYYGYYQSPTLHSRTLYKEVLEGFTPRQHNSTNLLVFSFSRLLVILRLRVQTPVCTVVNTQATDLISFSLTTSSTTYPLNLTRPAMARDVSTTVHLILQ